MNKYHKHVIVSAFIGFLALSLTVPTFARAGTIVGLGAADNFAVLAGTTVTNTGPSVINGDLGLSPGSSVTGFLPGIVNGVQQIANQIALDAKEDLIAAYDRTTELTPTMTIGTELGGKTLTPGIYESASGTFEITGTLTLDAQNNPNAVFIFKTASTLVTAVSSNVVLINGAQSCNVLWQVGSSATLQTYSTFKGSILALTSVTVTTGVNVEGRVLARNGAVTLDTDTITKTSCAVPSLPNAGEGDSTPWNTIMMTGIGIVALAALMIALKKRKI